jgi:molybdopterin synthase catalytic subunit
MASAQITRDPIDTTAVLDSVRDPGHGAVALFLGLVRDVNDERPVSGMRYDAYEAMALDVLREIVADAEREMGAGEVAAVHRIGELAIGDVSVAIAVGSAHRAPAFDAARYVIEEIKRRLPVWKQEHYADGDVQWLAGQVPQI